MPLAPIADHCSRSVTMLIAVNLSALVVRTAADRLATNQSYLGHCLVAAHHWAVVVTTFGYGLFEFAMHRAGLPWDVEQLLKGVANEMTQLIQFERLILMH